jgi:DNA-3-methyladenine glycosylase II
MAMRRFRVVEESMVPALHPGEEIVVTDSRPPTRGDIVVLPHPHRSDFWLVKRMAEPDGRIPSGTTWVLSDNHDATTADSRRFGPVPTADLMPRVERLDGTTFLEAVRLLEAEDTALRRLVADHGVPAFWERPSGFGTLVLLILEQQVSLESGMAMYRRLQGLCGSVGPHGLLRAGEVGLRGIGVTRQKTGYLLGLADAVSNGAFDPEALEEMTESAARAMLISLKGIGAWTADAYLLAALRRPDIFPLGDRALQVGAQEALGINSVPTEPELELLSQPWRPIRSAAARLIWHAYLNRRGRVELPIERPAQGMVEGA